MFLYMVSELSAIGQVVNTLTGLDALPVLIVECFVTTVYTCKFAYVSSSVLTSKLTLDSSRRIQDLLHHR